MIQHVYLQQYGQNGLWKGNGIHCHWKDKHTWENGVRLALGYPSYYNYYTKSKRDHWELKDGYDSI